MDSSSLKQRVEAWFNVSRGQEWALLGPVQVEPVLNWGGFAKKSFRIRAANRQLHLKLAASHDQMGMRRWLAVHDRLEALYHAPRIHQWMDLPGTEYGGLLFDHIEARVWSARDRPQLVPRIIDVLGRVHGDAQLADRLGDGERSYRECWELRYREQFEQDLHLIRGNTPPFVSQTTLNWMEKESRKLLETGRTHPAFEGSTRSPCHWDPWPDNILVSDDDRWWILDWDGLAVGDEAQDVATVTCSVQPLGDELQNILSRQRGEAFAERVGLHLRATLLDYAIDSIADWIECDVAAWQDEVQKRKQADHQTYLEAYRQQWG